MRYPFWDEDEKTPAWPAGPVTPKDPAAAARPRARRVHGPAQVKFSLPRVSLRRLLPLGALLIVFTFSWLWMPVGNTWWAMSLGANGQIDTGQFPNDDHGCSFHLTAHGLWEVWEMLYPDRPPDLYKEIIGVHGQFCLQGKPGGGFGGYNLHGWVEYRMPGGFFQPIPGGGFDFVDRDLLGGDDQRCGDYRIEFAPIPGAQYRVIGRVYAPSFFKMAGFTDDSQELIADFSLPEEPVVVEQLTPTPTETATETLTETPTPTGTGTETETPTPSPTANPGGSDTAIPTDTPTPTPTVTRTPTATPSATPSGEPTTTPTATPGATDTPVASPTDAQGQPPTPTPTPTGAPTSTDTPVPPTEPPPPPTESPTLAPTNPPPPPTDTPVPPPTNTPVVEPGPTDGSGGEG